jgi:hypothetical protein
MNGTADEGKDYERVGRLLYGLQRSCGGVEGLRGLKTDPRVAPDTAERGAALADRYEALLARFQRKPQDVGGAEVDAFLGDAGALADEVGQQAGSGWMYDQA